MNKFLDKCFLFRRTAGPELSRGQRAAYWAWRWVLLLCAGVSLGALMLIFAYGHYPWGVFLGYMQDPAILVMNILPAVLLVLLFYGFFGRCWAAFLAAGAVSLGFSLGNYFKLCFRDDPLYFEDMLILREAKNMAGSYQLFVDKRVVTAVACIALGTLVLAALARGRLRWRGRGIALGALAVSGLLLFPLYMDEDYYQSIENFGSLNRWSPTQNYISRGFFYPFVHSIGEFVDTAPEGYSRGKAEALLEQYSDEDIPQDRQINVIAIMREAYMDFSRYDIPGLDTSGFDLYHQLEAESYTGDLLTNIFAGGTIDTERCFLTGDYKLKNFRGSTNSYLWYLRDQGYTVEGSHPYYQWFYNRQNVNSYLGFQRYRFLEGDFDQLTRSYYPEDSILYQEVYRDFQDNKATGRPYFSFVLNVQSHGPYDTEQTAGEAYLTGDYSPACKNAMNNYMNAIMDGDRQLTALVDRLRTDPEPVVLVTFGDHLPWMGDSNVYYQEMGLDIDPGTEQGFRTHYTTRYLIWANDAARAVLGSDLVGEGPTISPCYLMNLVFDQLGWTGPAYMQAMGDMMAAMPVVTTHGCYVVDGKFTDAIPREREDLFRDFQYLQHYWRSEFLFTGTAQD